MIRTGLDDLLARPEELGGRAYGLLAHAASVTAELEPAHVALVRRGAPPAALFSPEHGYYGIEQDMVASADAEDPLTGIALRSLYGDGEESLRPSCRRLRDIDLLVIDLQDVGSRYYTYAATAVWAAEVAAAAGVDVWVLDRPNPLGGEVVEGNLPRPGLESFVSAFEIPVRHGLTLAELVLFEARRRGFGDAVKVWPMSGWKRSMVWAETGRRWLAPSPNMPTTQTAEIYPGGCLLEATTLSEGRGTTRPFQLVGAPGVDAGALAERLTAARLPGVAFIPTYFRPQFQKHAGRACGGVEIVVTGRGLEAYRTGVELLFAVRDVAPAALGWRREPYEFVTDRPAIDLLTGDVVLRTAIDGGGDAGEWIASWDADELAFRRAREEALCYD